MIDNLCKETRRKSGRIDEYAYVGGTLLASADGKPMDCMDTSYKLIKTKM